jgi:16S rRNA G966 N2-methylase RsmD
MLISDEYTYLYTCENQSLQILYIFKKYCKNLSAELKSINDYTIVDATSGMGGNSLHFCKYFKYVYCVDISSYVMNYLENNLKEYTNKYIINENCLDIIKIIKYNVIFFDPPWGGSSYKYQKSLNLYLNGLNVNDIIETLFMNKDLKIIGLKAPINFNINHNTLWKLTIHNIYKNDNINVLFKFLVFNR